MSLGDYGPAFRQRLLDDYALSQHRLASRSMKERFQMLCQCQNPRELGCSAVLHRGGWNYFNTSLTEFLRGQIEDPFCGRGGNKVMKGGLFKGRRYCWQHYPAYAICDMCLDYDPDGYGLISSHARWIYVWEHHPKRQPRKTYHWEERGQLMRGPEWPIPSAGHNFDKEWAERLIETEEWILQKSMWLCGTCRDVLDKRIDSANTKQRKNLIKQAKALKEGKETYIWLRKYLRNNTRGA